MSSGTVTYQLQRKNDVPEPVSAKMQPHATSSETIRNFLHSDFKRAPGLKRMQPIQYAVICGRVDVTAWYLSKGADVHKRDSTGMALLHTAVFNGRLNIARLLIEHGADANFKDSHGKTPIYYVPARRSDLMDLLIGAGANIDAKRFDGISALMMAVCRGETERVAMFLKHAAEFNDKQPFYPLLDRNDPLSPLQAALWRRHIEVFKVLVQRGADYNAPMRGYGVPILHYAAFMGDCEAVEILVSAGANVHSKDNWGHTAVHEAIRSNTEASLKTIGILATAGGDLEAVSNIGRTPLHEASSHGHANAVRALLNNGAEVDTRTPSGETALHLASTCRKKDNIIVNKLLLDHGASTRAKASYISSTGL